MKKTVSIKNNHEFKRLYYKGGYKPSGLLVLYFKKNGLGNNRLGITVSKKVGKAVVRNRVRRLIKENYRLLENRIKNSYDFVIVARGRAAEADFHDIKRAMLYVFEKCDLLSE